MRRRRGQVELRGIRRIIGGERHIHAAHRHVQAILRAQRVGGAVDGHAAAAATDIDHAQLAALEERMAGGRGRFGLFRQVDCLGHRGGAADHEAFVVRVIQLHAIGHEQVADQVTVAQLVVAGAVHHVRVGGVVGLAEHGRSVAAVVDSGGV